MTISVLIPTFNRAPVLARALNSVLNQTQAATEIIVIDDGSTDGTKDLVRNQYPDVKYIYQDNAGVSAARNKGILEATGDWIAFLDSDDEWLPEKLARQIEFISNNPDAVLIYTNETWVRKGKKVNPGRQHQKFDGRIFEECLEQCFIGPSSSLIRTSLFDSIGLFDEKFHVCEDYDLWLRIANQHYIHYLDEELIVKYGGHADQLSTQFWGMDAYRVRAIVKLLESGRLEHEEWKVSATNIAQKKCEFLLKGAKKHRNDSFTTEIEDLILRLNSHI